METVQSSNNGKRILNFCLLLTGLSTAIVLIMGWSVANVNKETKGLKYFLSVANDVQPNFEKSLIMYTESSKDIIEFLLKLRPGKEEEYIAFIDEVESIGRKLSLNLKLESFEENSGVSTIKTSGASSMKTLNYSLSFYGSFQNMSDFLKKLEQLPYFIKVENINFTDVALAQKEENIPLENVNIKIKLYIK